MESVVIFASFDFADGFDGGNLYAEFVGNASVIVVG